MLDFRLITASALAASALFAGSASAAPSTDSKVPAPFAGCDYVRGVTLDDGHSNEIGKGHHLHGNGWGYGHGCGESDGGGDNGGGGDTGPVLV